MSENAEPVSQPPVTTNSTEQSSIPTVTSGGQEYTASTLIHSVEELRTKEPELYRLIMEGYATNIIKEQNRSMRRIKEMNRESQRQQNS